VNYIERVTGMMTNELVAVSQNDIGSDVTAKQVLLTSIISEPQITAA